MATISIITINQLHRKIFGYYYFSSLIIQMLTMQQNYLIDKKFSMLSRKISPKSSIIIIIVVIWLHSASILSKAFTGILLNTYFKVKSVPTVNSLEDIYDNKELSILTTKYQLNYVILQRIPLPQRKAFRQRSTGIPFDELLTSDLFNNLTNGKLVVVINSHLRDQFAHYFSHWKHRFGVGHMRYDQNFLSFYSRKNLTISYKMDFL